MTESKPNTIPAATVIVFRRNPAGGPAQVLMLERSGEMRFAGGAAVFPGGRVDEADRKLAAKLGHGLAPDEGAARIAALRETLEEAGLALGFDAPVTGAQAADARAMLLELGSLEPVLQHFGWQPDLNALTIWARWCPDWEGAFDTRFYLADLGTGAVEIAVDDTEHTHMFWTTAADAIDMADRGDISIIFPTRRNLERLALFENFEDARRHALATPVETISPLRREIDGIMYLTIPEGLGYPVTIQRLDTVKRG